MFDWFTVELFDFVSNFPKKFNLGRRLVVVSIVNIEESNKSVGLSRGSNITVWC